MMEVKSVIYFFMLHLCIFSTKANEAKADDFISSCSTLCLCKEVRKEFKTIEFRVICTGNGTQSIILSDAIYDKEPIPNHTRRTYVRIENFSRARVETSFLSRWSAYISCSFDVWNSGNVSFPDEAPPAAETEAIAFIFAGVGVSKSSMEKFPKGLFRNKPTIGLRIISSKINYLNLFELSQKDLNYVNISNSIIKTFEGDPKESLKLTYSSNNGEPNIILQNSKISYVGSNALSIRDYNGLGTLSIVNTTISVIERTSINLGKGIIFKLETSTIDHVPPLSFNFKNKRSNASVIVNNLLTLEKDALTNLKCNSAMQIYDNFIHPKYPLSYYLTEYLKVKNMSTSLHDNGFEMNDFIDNACENNHLTGNFLMSHEYSTTTISPLITILTPNNSINNEYNSSLDQNFTTDNSNEKGYTSKLRSHLEFPVGLFYLVVGLCLFLIVMIIVLTMLVIWGKLNKRQNNFSIDREAKKFVRI